MKLWDKGYSTAEIIEKFTVGKDRELDLKLAPYDVQGNMAHARMLHKIGILSEVELEDILNGLKAIMTTVRDGTFVIEEEFEDVHSKIEFELVRQIGDAGKKIHTGRSRNDQVLLDISLYLKEEIKALKKLIKHLFHQLIEKAEEHREILMPGYTHLQIAMPSSFGLWFSAYAESLVDDMIFLNAAHRIADQNPLGSAAGYGTSFPIDRSMTTELMGFSTMKYNVVAAQMMRGRLEKLVSFALSSIGGTLSKLSSDVCLYMSQNFAFISLPKELTTGSSIMPHKQNPDVFELIRAKSNKIQNVHSEITMITNNLPSGYHRDFQLLKESLIPAIDTLKEILEVTIYSVGHISVNENILENPIYDHLYSVEEVNKLVMHGMTFRDAYRTLGEQILQGNFEPARKVEHTHEGSSGNLCLEEIKMKFENECKRE